MTTTHLKRQPKRNETWFLHIADMMLRDNMSQTCWFRSCPEDWLTDQVEDMLKRKGKTADRDEILDAIRLASEIQEIRAERTRDETAKANQLSQGAVTSGTGLHPQQETP